MEHEVPGMESLLQPPGVPDRAVPRIRALQQRFAFEIRPESIGPHLLRLGTVSCSDSLLDELIAMDPGDIRLRDERLPYWAEVWPSALALAKFIAERPYEVSGRAVLELGCGQGLPGVVAGLCGGKVLLTDYDETALEFAALNWVLNLETPPNVQRLDWRDDPQIPACDLLLAADVAYERRSFAPLLAAFDRCLAPGGSVWMTEPRRQLAEPFFQTLADSGFTVQTEVREVSTSAAVCRVDLHQIRRA